MAPSAFCWPKRDFSAYRWPKWDFLAYSWPKWALERPKSTFRLPVGRKVSGAQNVIKMASNEKVINMKNLRLVETVDFDIKIVLI